MLATRPVCSIEAIEDLPTNGAGAALSFIAILSIGNGER